MRLCLADKPAHVDLCGKQCQPHSAAPAPLAFDNTQMILEILRATKHDLPDYWKASLVQ